jgi:general stress protein 26
MSKLVDERSIATNEVAAVTPWAQAQKQLADTHNYWLATVRPDGRPHVMPLFAVWSDGSLYFTSNESARKAKNLALNPHCVITVAGEGLDLIVEGEAQKVRDEATLQRIADLYHAKYGWLVTVSEGAYDAPFGAPSAGLPPYELYQVDLTKAFGLGTEEPFGATRWRFA